MSISIGFLRLETKAAKKNITFLRMMLVVLRNYAEYDDNVTHVKIIEKNLHAVYNVSPRRRGIPSSLYLFVSTTGRKKTVNLPDETRCHSAEGQTDTRCSL